MTIRSMLRIAAIVTLTAASSAAMAQEVIRLRIASGHPPANTYVNLMQSFFVPEVTKRVAAKTKYKVEFVEGYGGAMVKVADTLEGVQSGIIDIGGYCFCFEPSKKPPSRSSCPPAPAPGASSSSWWRSGSCSAA